MKKLIALLMLVLMISVVYGQSPKKPAMPATPVPPKEVSAWGYEYCDTCKGPSGMTMPMLKKEGRMYMYNKDLQLWMAKKDKEGFEYWLDTEIGEEVLFVDGEPLTLTNYRKNTELLNLEEDHPKEYADLKGTYEYVRGGEDEDEREGEPGKVFAEAHGGEPDHDPGMRAHRAKAVAKPRYYLDNNGRVRQLSPEEFDKLTDAQKKREIPEEAARAARDYGGVATWSADFDSFTFEPEPRTVSGTWQDTRTTPTVTIIVGEDALGRPVITRITEREVDVCGKGLTTCKRDDPKAWEKVHEAHSRDVEVISETIIDGESVSFRSREGRTLYEVTYDGGNPTGTRRVAHTFTDYGLTGDGKYREVKGEEVTAFLTTERDGVITTTQEIVYKVVYNPETGEANVIVDSKKIDDLPISEEEKEKLRGEVNKANSELVSAGAGGKDPGQFLTFAQLLGRWMRAFKEFSGLRQYSGLGFSNYHEDVQRRKAKMKQEFCLFAGISDCLTSAVCGAVKEIDADNVLIGRGPTGGLVSSANLVASRSTPAILEGLNRQQLIDLLGEVAVIGGRVINFTDPQFNPSILGRQKIRLYHVQYGITNNAETRDTMRYNLEFRRIADTVDSSYGDPIRTAKYFVEDEALEYGSTGSDDIKQYSATEYNNVCLTFHPRLPSGSQYRVRLVSELCVPIVESAGGPTSIPPEEARSVSTDVETGVVRGII